MLDAFSPMTVEGVIPLELPGERRVDAQLEINRYNGSVRLSFNYHPIARELIEQVVNDTLVGLSLHHTAIKKTG
jgi:hypothetical protein